MAKALWGHSLIPASGHLGADSVSIHGEPHYPEMSFNRTLLWKTPTKGRWTALSMKLFVMTAEPCICTVQMGATGHGPKSLTATWSFWDQKRGFSCSQSSKAPSAQPRPPEGTPPWGSRASSRPPVSL